MADTTATTAPHETDNALSTLWNDVVGKIGQAASDAFTDNVAPLVIGLMEMLKSWMGNTSWFGNGSIAMNIIDDMEKKLQTQMQPADPAQTATVNQTPANKTPAITAK
jgi:hypothetical protein